MNKATQSLEKIENSQWFQEARQHYHVTAALLGWQGFTREQEDVYRQLRRQYGPQISGPVTKRKIDMLFRKATHEDAYLKMAIAGFQGSGKTYTATEVAVGLVKHLQKHDIKGHDKPVYFIDSDGGAGFVRARIESATGMDLMLAKTKSFADLASAIKIAEQNGSVLIVDSITHYWTELLETYLAKKKRRFGPEIQDWGVIKGLWRKKFVEPFLNSNLHIILCGRAGYEYDNYTDQDGRRKMEKSGTKMKAEGETGFEASIFVMMERTQRDKKIAHTAHIYKDRTRHENKAQHLDGKSFDDPTFETFLPHISALNLGGEQQGIDFGRSSEDLIEVDGERREEWKVKRSIVLEEIETLLVRHHPSTGAADKKAKLDLIKEHFGCVWKEIELVMSLPDIQQGYDSLHQALEGQPSRYNEAKPTSGDIDDEIPEFDNAKPDAKAQEQTQPAKTEAKDAAPAQETPEEPVVEKDPDEAARLDGELKGLMKGLNLFKGNETRLRMIWESYDEVIAEFSEEQLSKAEAAFGRALPKKTAPKRATSTT